jgi:hypothetical protein
MHMDFGTTILERYCIEGSSSSILTLLNASFQAMSAVSGAPRDMVAPQRAREQPP